MPIQINELTIKANPNAAILALEARVAQLEEALEVVHGKVTLSCGSAKISMSANGNINITGNEITMSSFGKLSMKSANELVLKGAKVTQN